MDAILAEGLTKHFGKFVAVRNVSFTVKKGEIFGFLGPNGSGKTTVIKMLCGLLTPTAGKAIVNGVDVQADPEGVKQTIGYMSQRFSLYEDLTVRENMTFYANVYGLHGTVFQQRLAKAIQESHIQPYLNRSTAQLSGGWKQRLALACALLHEPSLLFLDEPTAGIDPVARRDLWDLFFDLASRGKTLFVTTHYMDEAERCTHVGYIYHSQLLANGDPSTLKLLPEVTPQNAKRLEVSCDNLTAGLQLLKEAKGVQDATLFGQTLHLLVARQTTQEEILQALDKAAIGGGTVREISPSLEDVFVRLTRQATSKEKASPTKIV